MSLRGHCIGGSDLKSQRRLNPSRHRGSSRSGQTPSHTPRTIRRRRRHRFGGQPRCRCISQPSCRGSQPASASDYPQCALRTAFARLSARNSAGPCAHGWWRAGWRAISQSCCWITRPGTCERRSTASGATCCTPSSRTRSRPWLRFQSADQVGCPWRPPPQPAKLGPWPTRTPTRC